jgi:hypothetical protein
MFCPTCGRENSVALKFCASCGTNLEAISRALTVGEEGLFTKVETALDQFIARYAEHLFKDAPSRAVERQVSKSWQVLGQGALTGLFDLLLFTIMTVVLPTRFLILLVYTPIKLLSDRGKQPKTATAELADRRDRGLAAVQPQRWLPDSVASVTEHTTLHLADSAYPKQNPGRETGPTDRS